MPDPDFYAPAPSKIKTVIVAEVNGATATYPDLPSAVTAVYRLHPAAAAYLVKYLKDIWEMNNAK